MKAMNYNENLIILDLETSGLDSKTHEIIQFAALNVCTGERLELKLFFDESKASPEALKINHYDPKVWEKEAVSQIEGLSEINRFFKENASFTKISRKGKPYNVAVVGGYNVNAFDKDFLIDSFQRHDIFMVCDYRFYDFYPLVMFAYPGLLCYKLEDINKYLELPPVKAHDAMGDVYATANVAACALYDTFKGGEHEENIPDWAYDRLERLEEK